MSLIESYSVYLVRLLALLLVMALQPFVGTAQTTAYGDQLVGTILGTAPKLGEQDFRTDAELVELSDFVFLPSGEMLIADAVQSRIFRVGRDSLMRHFAGTGSLTHSGDGGPAIQAGIPGAHRIALDGSGNIYVAERHVSASRIRRIAPNGLITTIAGNGEPGCPEVGSLATNAPMGRFGMTAMVTDQKGNLHLSLSGCQHLYRINQEGIIGHVGLPEGTSADGFQITYDPFEARNLSVLSVGGFAVDAVGNVWVNDLSSRSLRKITPDGVVLSISADGSFTNRDGPVKKVHFPYLSGLILLPHGEIFVSQTTTTGTATSYPEVGIINSNGEYTVLASKDGYGNTPPVSYQGSTVTPTLARLSPDGKIYIADSNSMRIFQVNRDGTLEHYFGRSREASLEVTPGATPVFRAANITNLVADPQGNIYFGDIIGRKVYRLSPSGTLTHIGGNGEIDGDLVDGPATQVALGIFTKLAIDSQRRIYVDSTQTQRLRRFTVDGVVETVLGRTRSWAEEGAEASGTYLGRPHTWDVSPEGEVYFYQESSWPGRYAPRVWKAGIDGKLKAYIGTQWVFSTGGGEGKAALEMLLSGAPYHLKVDVAGTVFFVAHTSSSTVYYVDREGIVRAAIGKETTSSIPNSGDPTIAAPAPLMSSLFQTSGAGCFLVSNPFTPLLSEYVVGGSVGYVRSPESKLTRQDGGRLGDDRFLHNFIPSVIRMPDGGLAWSERINARVTIRRSFPVPAGCTYTLSAKELTVPADGGPLQVTLNTGSNCPWTAGASATWLAMAAPYTGQGNAKIQVQTIANPSPVERTARLRLAGHEIIVRQPASPRSNIFEVSPTSVDLPASSATVDVSITASSNIEWQVSALSSGLSLVGQAAGTGSSIVQLSITALPAGQQQRTLSAEINGQRILLHQTAVATAVPVSITSSMPGATISVDLVSKTLPYQGFWLPGSTHLLQTNDFLPASPGTIRQFQGWGLPSTDAEQLVTTPNHPTTLTASYRNVHQLRWSENTSLDNDVVASTLGLYLPTNQNTEALLGRGGWYVEGSTVDLLGINSSNLKFVNFTGDISSTQNPLRVHVTKPMLVTANRVLDPGLSNQLQVGSGSPVWTFVDSSVNSNPVQVTVDHAGSSVSEQPTLFLTQSLGSAQPSWLQVRKSTDGLPSTFELSVDPHKASRYQNPVTLYWHVPNARTVVTAATINHNHPIVISGRPRALALTDAGGFRQYATDQSGPHTKLTVAPGMILTIFGRELADSAESADQLPLPTVLGGAQVLYEVDANMGVFVPLPLFYASPTQINFMVPNDLVSSSWNTYGDFRVRVRRAGHDDSLGQGFFLRDRSASLFSADSSGNGAPAGAYIRVRPSGAQERGDLFHCEATGCEPALVSFGGEDDELYLELYGTGFHNPGDASQRRVYLDGQPVEVTYAGAHPTYVGLDQLNVKVPRSVRRGQPLDLYLWVRNGENPWIASNRLVVRLE